MTERIVVVGNGMVGHKFLEVLRSRTQDFALTVVTEEPCLAYDRVRLSEFFNEPRPNLSLGSYEQYAGWGVRIINARAIAIDRERKRVISAQQEVPYDILVLATGSYPFVPTVEGHDLEGCFTYRTLEDLTRIEAWAKHSRKGVVIGGGLLGLEAAGALLKLGLQAHVVELAPCLMPLQLDELGGQMLKRKLEALGIGVHLSKATQRIEARGSCVAALHFADGSSLETDLVIFSAGIRPRDELARQSGLEVGERGGIVIDEHCRTSDPHIYAIGECALYQGRVYGLVAPGYEMARVLAERLTGGERSFSGADLSTKLKLLGVEVGSFGDAFARTLGAQEIHYTNFGKGIYKKLVLSEDGKRLLGGILVGDTSDYANLHSLVANAVELDNPEHLLVPPAAGSPTSKTSLPMTARVCSCENVTKGAICEAIGSGCRDIASLKKATIFVIAICSLWPTLINTSLGVSSIPQDYRNVARVYAFSPWIYLTRVVLPHSLLYVLTGFRLGMGIAWMVIVVAEMLAGGSGVGFFVWDSYNSGQLEYVMAAILFIGLVGWLLDAVLEQLIRRFRYS
ncbi:FAD-dependent oxidoreductase [Meiothermus rufus]|uniref:FAD-dependent oxidoreductase n=1 Tax=Meiothermus rufus TaxID=604332 RepID=UPI0004017DC2|nr:FAD-dependent oxidoreductase [Meiothermus rufus]